MALPHRIDGQALRLVDLPLALARAHRAVAVGDHVQLILGRTLLDDPRLPTIVAAGAFDLVDMDDRQASLRSRFGLPDHVRDGLRLLCVGLNPSLHAAEAGIGYVTASNRFWRVLALAGITTVDRDPLGLAEHDRIGMTDLVKRPTARADELTTVEYREGLARLEALCAWLQPEAVAIVGLAGWRAAVDRRASVGWQERHLGPSPTYVLPSTSGLNAGTSLDDLVVHLRSAASPPAV